jgi:hypothetical protein
MNNKLKTNMKKLEEPNTNLSPNQALINLRDTFLLERDSISYIATALGMLGLHDTSNKIETSLDAIEKEIELLEKAIQEDLSRQIQIANEHAGNMLNAALAGIKITKGNK